MHYSGMGNHTHFLVEAAGKEILRTPTEVRRVRAYHVTNARHPHELVERDAFCSTRPLALPRTCLLRRHC